MPRSSPPSDHRRTAPPGGDLSVAEATRLFVRAWASGFVVFVILLG